MADVADRINEIEQRLNRIDRRRESLELQIEDNNEIGASTFFDVRILRDLNREAEALSAELNTLKNEQGDLNSAKGQTAESQVDNTQPPTFEGEGVQAFTPNPEPLTEEEENKAAGFDGSTVEEETPAIVSSEDDAASGFNGDLSGDIPATVGNNSAVTTPLDQQQQELAVSPVTTRSNVLHEYNTYTYRITLYLLTKGDYKNLIDNPNEFVPKHVLISSGGGYAQEGSAFGLSNQPGRHPDFQEEFFIDNLNMTTIVGMNRATKASNAITVGFDIVEPYGISLLDRLMSACEVTADCPNYLDQPYLLEIDFIGNAGDDITSNKDNVIDNTRKRIPIKFIEMNISPNVGGTQYRIEAIPFNHTAFQQSQASVPVEISCEAGTVGEFFGTNNKLGEFTAAQKKNQERAQSDLDKFLADQPRGGAGLSQSERDALLADFVGAQPNVLVSSYADAINSYYTSIAGPNKAFKDPPIQVKFNIDEKFRNAKIVDNIVFETRTAPMSKEQESQKQTFQSVIKSRTVQAFQVAAGTNMVTLIDRAMRSSSYITEQLDEWKLLYENFSQGQTGEGRGTSVLDDFRFLDWYKIIPEVELVSFDLTQKAYTKTLTYNVVPYKVANAYHPDFHKTKIAKDSIVRSYSYLYTGQNVDIIDFRIDFDTAYYTAWTQNKNEKSTSGTSNPLKNPESVSYIATPSGKVAISQDQNKDNDPAVKTVSRGASVSDTGQLNTNESPTAHTADDIADSIYSSSRGDMLNVRLGIIGDPSFIKQDDVYYQPGKAGYDEFVIDNNIDAPITPTGQIIFDTKQVFVQIIVGGTIDIDDELGIVNKGSETGKTITLLNGKRLNSSFNGVYKVIKVDTKLKGGVFSQHLDLIKMPNSTFDNTEQLEQAANAGELVLEPGLQDNQQVDDSAPAPQVVENVFNIQPDNIGALQEAANQDPDGVFPIVNGAGTPDQPQQVTESAPVNVNDSEQADNFNNSALATQIQLNNDSATG